MTESLWWPGLVSLLVGAGVGLFAIRRFLKTGSGAAGDRSHRDIELEVADLERRRDHLYRRLRGETDEELSVADLEGLELSAARTLRDLEGAEKRLAAIVGPRAKKRPNARKHGAGGADAADTSPQAATQGSWISRHPLISGFALGGGMVAVLALLVFWAMRDTASQRAAAGNTTATGATEPVHQEAGEIPPEAAARLAELDAGITVNPDDNPARRERALINLGAERYFEAFQDSEVLLAADPQDIDGLYIQGVVRVTMGMADEALDLFEQVLQLFPQHVQALGWRGIVYYQQGKPDDAIVSWRRGIEAAGGRQPELERLIQAAETSVASEERGPDTPAVAAGVTLGVGAPPPAEAPARKGTYRVWVALADGAVAPPRAVLFVSLTGSAPGPPAAVRRIGQPNFPLVIDLSQDDSMLGRPLPGAGTLAARLDSDGNASTRTEGDLEARADAEVGSQVELLLAALSGPAGG